MRNLPARNNIRAAEAVVRQTSLEMNPAHRLAKITGAFDRRSLGIVSRRTFFGLSTSAAVIIPGSVANAWFPHGTGGGGGGTTFLITVIAAPMAAGSVTGGGTFSSGSMQTVVATVNSGYSFVNWTDSSITTTVVDSTGAVWSLGDSYDGTNAQIWRNGFWYAGGFGTELALSGGNIYSLNNAGQWQNVVSGVWTNTTMPGGITQTLLINASQVSASTSYTFTLTGNITLVANFTGPHAWPTPGGGTNVYMANAPLGNDSNNGTSNTTPWLTLAKVGASAPANSTINVRGGDRFQFALGANLTLPSGAVIQSTGWSNNPATILGNRSGTMITGASSGNKILGLKIIGDNSSTSIVSGTYDNGVTNQITLTMTAPVPFGPGANIYLRNLFGTGAVASLNTTSGWTALPGTTGTTVVLQGPSSVGAATITSGSFAEQVLTYFGVEINNVPNCVISGCMIGNFYGPGFSGPGGGVNIAGDCNGMKMGAVLSTDARFGGTIDNIIGGINGPLSRDEVGVLFNFCAVTPGNIMNFEGNLIQNCGACVNPGTGANGQVGFGAHLTVLPNTFAARPFTWDMTTGEPTNALCYVHGNVIRNIGAYINTCGGASGLEWGSSWCVVEDGLDISYVGPIGTATCSCSGTTLTVLGDVGGMSLDDFATMRFNVANFLGIVTISGGGFPSFTTIVSGSGSTWTVSNSMTFGATKLTFLGNAGGACDQDGTDVDTGCQNVLRERDYVHDCFGPSVLEFFGGGDGPHYTRYNLGVNCGAFQEGNSAIAGGSATGKLYSYNNTYIGMREPAPNDPSQAVNYTLDSITSSFPISSGTYNSGTGVITLSFAFAVNFSGAGFSIIISSLTGASGVSGLNGTWFSTSATGGSTIVLQGPMGVSNAATITGGTVNSGLNGFSVNNIYITYSPSRMLLATAGIPPQFLLSHNNYGGIGTAYGSVPGYQLFQMFGTQYGNNTGGAAWVAAGRGSDQNGFFYDPLFHNPFVTDTPADWQLSTISPLIGVGIDVTTISATDTITVAQDFYGNSPGATKNVGCFAFGPGV